MRDCILSLSLSLSCSLLLSLAPSCSLLLSPLSVTESSPAELPSKQRSSDSFLWNASAKRSSRLEELGKQSKSVKKKLNSPETLLARKPVLSSKRHLTTNKLKPIPKEHTKSDVVDELEFCQFKAVAFFFFL